jgi:hypothetical protein
MPTRSKEADARRKEEEAMAAATLQWEKEAAARRQKEETAATAAGPIDTPATVTAAKSIGKSSIIIPPANPPHLSCFPAIRRQLELSALETC